MNIIQTVNMPQSNGHYSQCIQHNGLLYLSGQLPIDKKTKSIPKTIEEQTRLVLMKIETILQEAGTDRNNVLQIRVYISDIALWDKVDKEYAAFFQNHKPTRCIIPTRELHYGCLIEVEVTAKSKN